MSKLPKRITPILIPLIETYKHRRADTAQYGLKINLKANLG